MMEKKQIARATDTSTEIMPGQPGVKRSFYATPTSSYTTEKY